MSILKSEHNDFRKNKAVNQKAEESAKSLTHLLSDIRRALPVVDKVLSEHGDKTIAEYLVTQNQFSSASYQPREDLAEVVYQYAKVLLGEDVARIAADELRINPVVLTANHHGVDYFAQSVQGTLMFSLRRIAGKRAKTIPVFACGNIPLDNLTYPRGLLLYPPLLKKGERFPYRLPLFSNKYRRETVSAVKSIDDNDLGAFNRRLAKDATISNKKVINDVISDFYSINSNQQRYSHQSTQINAALWQAITKQECDKTALVYLELEKVATELILLDIRNESSLFYRIFFSKAYREALINELDDATGCWKSEELLRRLNQENGGQFKQAGTFMFWGVDKRGRRIPLMLTGGEKGAVLAGRSDSGENWTLSIEPNEIHNVLKNKQVIPSIFSCFLVIAIARGVTCLGGYYQAEYLPVMKRGVEKLFEKFSESCSIPCKTDGYLSGMQPIMSNLDGGLWPIGPIEMLHFDLCGSIEDAANVSVLNAHIGSISETLNDVLPVEVSKQEVVEAIAQETYLQCSSSLVLVGFNKSTERKF